MRKVSRCLISVSDKSRVVELAKFLESIGVEIVSTGGTKALLQGNDIKVQDISDFTSFPEIMGGRVKTLHPKVHGGLLGVPDNSSHQEQAAQNDIKPIDLLVVNLYPFIETVARTDNEKEIIENIDIGGPAMIRSAAKNFEYKVVVTDVGQYQDLIANLTDNNGATTSGFRKDLARQAFLNIAKYDVAIANYFSQDDGSLGEYLSIDAKLFKKLRYGENSHQGATCYSNSNFGIVNANQIQGKELSYNNLNDSDTAYNLVKEFVEPACAIVKHANPCGAARSDNHCEAFKRALESDPKSAFGGIVAINGDVDKSLAEEVAKIFFEVVIAKSFSQEAKKILSKKKNLRLLELDFADNDKSLQVKSISGGFLVQEQDDVTITKDSLELATKSSVDSAELGQLVFAANICKYVKSNAIVIVNSDQIAGVGSGQTSRVDSMEIACKKAEIKGVAQGGYLASDAFFPFADNIEVAAKYGVKAIVAPKGSVRDQEVVDEANKRNIALYFIETRHFKH